jgi:hypothetical protein
MTQLQLDTIWAEIAAGNHVQAWRGHSGEDFDIMTQLIPHEIWVRKKPSGAWMKVPALTGNL